jgi:2'-5' RNA ligase
MARAPISRAELSGTQRVFFALWPGAKVRASLAKVGGHMHGALNGRRTRTESIHLTLAFLGNVDIEILPRLLDPPSGIAPAPFELTLDDWGCWARNGVGWVAPSRMPAPLANLAANLEDWLRGEGFSLQSRAFRPHVTLLRNADCAHMEGPMTPIVWGVSQYVLVGSVQSPQQSRYQLLGNWSLRGRN